MKFECKVFISKYLSGYALLRRWRGRFLHRQ